MAVRNFKEAMRVVVLTFLLAPAIHCGDGTTKASIAKPSDIENSPGLGRIKPLSAIGKPNPPAALLEEQRKSVEKVEDKQTQHEIAKLEVDLTNAHDADSVKAADVAAKKVSSQAPTPLRSNSSSSAAEKIPNKNRFFADRHQGNDASGAAVVLNGNSNSSPEVTMLHEHVERHQLHQSKEQDSVEDAGFKAPTSGATHEKVADSLAVSSGAFPVRLGPNTRIPGNSNIQNESGGGRIVAFRKPLPILRQEAAQPNIPSDNHHDDVHHNAFFT